MTENSQDIESGQKNAKGRQFPESPSEEGNGNDVLTAEEKQNLEALLQKEGSTKLIMQKASFSGPLPPPSILGDYNNVLEGSAERIMSLAEKEQEHRHYVEKKALNGHVNLDRRGQYLGFSVATFALGCATFLIANDYVISGTIIGSLDIVALVGVFVYGRHVSNKSESDSQD